MKEQGSSAGKTFPFIPRLLERSDRSRGYAKNIQELCCSIFFQVIYNII